MEPDEFEPLAKAGPIRTVDPQTLHGKRVYVYRNLHNGLFSVWHAGKVLAHVPEIHLDNAEFRVRESGRQKVLREKKKNVHAFVVGTVNSKPPAEKPSMGITYNPYMHPADQAGSFVRAHDKSSIQRADRAHLAVVPGPDGKQRASMNVHESASAMTKHDVLHGLWQVLQKVAGRPQRPHPEGTRVTAHGVYAGMWHGKTGTILPSQPSPDEYWVRFDDGVHGRLSHEALKLPTDASLVAHQEHREKQAADGKVRRNWAERGIHGVGAGSSPAPANPATAPAPKPAAAPAPQNDFPDPNDPMGTGARTRNLELSERKMTKHEALQKFAGKLADVAPQWLGRPTLATDHHHGLEMDSAVNEFGSKMPQKQAEDEAYKKYVENHRMQALHHHHAGMKAAAGAGDSEAARKHHMMYAVHAKALGLDPMSPPPARPSTEQPSSVYRFKAHKGDMYAVQDQASEASKPSEMTKSQRENLYVLYLGAQAVLSKGEVVGEIHGPTVKQPKHKKKLHDLGIAQAKKWARENDVPEHPNAPKYGDYFKDNPAEKAELKAEAKHCKCVSYHFPHRHGGGKCKTKK